MDSAWIGTVSALLGAAVGGGISLLRDHFSGHRQALRDEAQRQHDVSERRFEARRDAYVTFAAACHRAISATFEYEREHGALPGDVGFEGPHKSISDAQDLVMIIGPQEAALAAADAALKIDEWTFAYGKADFDDAYEAVEKFSAVTRRLLKFDTE